MSGVYPADYKAVLQATWKKYRCEAVLPSFSKLRTREGKPPYKKENLHIPNSFCLLIVEVQNAEAKDLRRHKSPHDHNICKKPSSLCEHNLMSFNTA